MAFTFSDRYIEEYNTQGFTIFDHILPASLIGDLRRVTEEAREVGCGVR